MLLAWPTLNSCGVLHFTCTSWRFFHTLLWLEVCCLCHDTPPIMAAGVKSRELFVLQSEKMMALVSAVYSKQLRCEYELAMFCKFAGSAWHKPTVFSLEWPGT